jgi:orotate phosphoribosyltransferase
MSDVEIVGDHNKAEVVRRLLVEGGACLPGGDEHYVGVSDKHLEQFWNFEQMFEVDNRDRLLEIIFHLATDISFAEFTVWGQNKPEILVGPADGGNLICQVLAPMLTQMGEEPIGVALTEKAPGKEFRLLDPEAVRGKRVLVVDDVMTSGLSTMNTVKACREAGAEVIGIFVVVDRENRTAEQLEVPYYGYLLAVNAVSYDVLKGEVCPLCEAGVHINVDIGHGAEYVAEHGQPTSRIEYMT